MQFKKLLLIIVIALMFVVILRLAVYADEYNVDLDIDSDNNNVFGEPDRSLDEDEMEDHPSKPGRIVAKNDDDNDGDQVPDFADGFNLDRIPDNEDDINLNQRFVPLVVEISSEIDLEQAQIRVIYNASNPANTVIFTEEPLVYESAPGALRIWAQPGDTARNPEQITERGDFVAPSEYRPAHLGLTNRNRTVTWYVEGIQTSRNLADQEIIIEVYTESEFAKDVVRLTIIDFQFMTQGPDGELVNQEFTYNSVPAPQLKATVQECQIDDLGLVTMIISGMVSDRVSGIVSNPEMQLRNITISPQNQTTYTLDLDNFAEPEYPWQPYKFQSSFSATVQLQTHYDSGQYWVSLKTSENLAGIAAELILFVIRDGRKVYCMNGIEVDPGTYIPTIMRVDAPEGTFIQDKDTIYAFKNKWPLKHVDLGDGKYWYAMDKQDHVVVLLPALYAPYKEWSSIPSPYPVMAIDKDLMATLVKYDKDISFRAAKKVEGLIVDNADVTTHLSKITNYAKSVYNWGNIKKYVYQPRTGWAGHLDNTLDTEIKWRYINNGDTIMDFKSKNEFLKDIGYRIKVEKTVQNANFGFGGPDFNPVYWEDYLGSKKVKAGKYASDAIADIFTGSYSYEMYCLRGALYVVENAAAYALSANTFNWRIGLFPEMYSWNVLKREMVKGSAPEKHAKWIPGDWGYILNMDPKPASGQEGENIIYMGGNWHLDVNNFGKNAIFWGHGGGKKKFQEWVDIVNSWSSVYGVDIFSHRDRLKQ